VFLKSWNLKFLIPAFFLAVYQARLITFGGLLVKGFINTLQGAKEEYKKALNYLNLVDMNKLRVSLSETVLY